MIPLMFIKYNMENDPPPIEKGKWSFYMILINPTSRKWKNIIRWAKNGKIVALNNTVLVLVVALLLKGIIFPFFKREIIFQYYFY